MLLEAEGHLEESLDVSSDVLTCYFRNIVQLNIILFGERKRAKKRPSNITDGNTVYLYSVCLCLFVDMHVVFTWLNATP